MLDRYDEAVTVDRWLLTEDAAGAAASVSRFASDHGMNAALLDIVGRAVSDAVSAALGRVQPAGGDVTIDAATDGDYLSVRVVATDPERTLEPVARAVTVGQRSEHIVLDRRREAGMVITIEAPMTAWG